MINYAMVDKDTNIIKHLMSWGKKEIAKDYPFEENEYAVCLSDEIYPRIRSEIILKKTLKIINKDATTFENFCIDEDVVIIKETKMDEDKLLMAEAIANLYEELMILKGEM